mgnify:FL=1
MRSGDGASEIDVAVFVDIDGTLCSFPKAGHRELRPYAVDALRELSTVAHVVLWSMGGRGAGERVLQKFPEIAPYVSHVTDKASAPFDLVRDAYTIDDGDVTECTARGNRITVSSFKGGEDSGALLEAAQKIVNDIRQDTE